MKKLFVVVITLYCIFILAGCSLFDKEYVSVNDYTYPLQSADGKDASSATVSTFAELKNAIIAVVDSGEEEAQIVVSELYSGNIHEDMSNAIWQVKSQDALCAYSVRNMTFDITTIVTYSEVNLHVSYSNIGIPLSDIHKLQYSTDLQEIIETSINNSEKRLVILVNKSSYSSSDMEKLIGNTYLENPIICPVEPKPTVKLFSGNNSQRLYEIDFNYLLDDDTLRMRKEELNNISLFTEEEMNYSDYDKLLVVLERLSSSQNGYGNTVYDSLIAYDANSEGYSLGFVALCREIGLETVIVYGQQNLEDFCWNIVKVDGNYYHVLPITNEDESILRTDEQMWGIFRWNSAEYPKCDTPYTFD